MIRASKLVGAACVLIAGCGSYSDARVAGRPTSASVGQAVVWAVGDGGDGSTAAKRLAGMIAAEQPDRLLYLGDVYPRGTASDFRRGYATTYGRLSAITLPTPGNHEWANRAIGYFPYWRKAHGRRQGSYSSTTVGGWQLLSLNSEAPHSRSSRQLRWLRRQLAAPGTCRLAFWHRPRFSAGTVHGDAADTAPLWSALRGHARLVVSGHEHNLQRFRRRDGITEYVSGAGGATLYGLRRDRRLAFARQSVRGALRIVLEPGEAKLEFRATSGRLLDRSRASCRP